MLALPVLAIRELDANEFQMGVLAAFESLAFLVIGLPAGAWVDRWRKKRVLVANDCLRALGSGFACRSRGGPTLLTLWQMYAVALVVGDLHGVLRRRLPVLPPRDRAQRERSAKETRSCSPLSRWRTWPARRSAASLHQGWSALRSRSSSTR